MKAIILPSDEMIQEAIHAYINDLIESGMGYQVVRVERIDNNGTEQWEVEIDDDTTGDDK